MYSKPDFIKVEIDSKSDSFVSGCTARYGEFLSDNYSGCRDNIVLDSRLWAGYVDNQCYLGNAGPSS